MRGGIRHSLIHCCLIVGACKCSEYIFLLCIHPSSPPSAPGLAALGRRTAQTLRQTTLAQLQQHLRDFLPAPLLSAADEGPNSRERVFSLRLTCGNAFSGKCSSPKPLVARWCAQVQALCRLNGWAPIAEGDSAYVQARQRLPQRRLEQALAATARAAALNARWQA